jgi:hypothetical protein
MNNPSASSRTPAPTHTSPAANKPVHTIRLGAIKAAIWENIVGENTRHSVSLCRLYKDGDQWKTAESFGRDDLLLLAKVADHAHTWICEQKAPTER